MKSPSVNLNNYIPLSDKIIISLDPPAIGKLLRNIFNGESCIAEHSRIVPVTLEQAEKIIENNFNV